MLCVIIQSVIILNILMPSVAIKPMVLAFVKLTVTVEIIMLSVAIKPILLTFAMLSVAIKRIMLSVVSPLCQLLLCYTSPC